MNTEPTILIGFGTLLLNSIGMWIKVAYDSRRKNSNGIMTVKMLGEVQKTLVETNRKVDDVGKSATQSATAIVGFKENCARMSGDLAKQVAETRQQVFEHVSSHQG